MNRGDYSFAQENDTHGLVWRHLKKKSRLKKMKCRDLVLTKKDHSLGHAFPTSSP